MLRPEGDTPIRMKTHVAQERMKEGEYLRRDWERVFHVAVAALYADLPGGFNILRQIRPIELGFLLYVRHTDSRD